MKTSTSILCVLAASTLLVAGCDRQGTGSTASQRMDQSSSKMADATSSMTTATGDTAITAKVKAALIAEPGLKSTDINVDTKDGTVTLTGNGDNPDMRVNAKQVASSTSGVKGVIDNLNVKTTS